LAATLLLQSGWHGQYDFLDSMCGTGTLLIEAAMIASRTPTGCYMKSFAFLKWKKILSPKSVYVNKKGRN
jgi:Predicted N6-adenine-specific DNA methylase